MKCDVLREISCVGLLIPVLLGGCATRRTALTIVHPFDFQKDTFAYTNQLTWEYHFDAKGKWVHHRSASDPDYTLHCFVVARSALQFFQNARFDPAQPRADEATYRRLIRRVAGISPRNPPSESEKVTIPGCANLREFSQIHEQLLKTECGGVGQVYFQRGHWRMIFPFSRRNQVRMAEALVSDLNRKRAAVVHLVRFPQLTINHAMLLFDAREDGDEIVFSAYDPNHPESPATLLFDRLEKRFIFPANDYFRGGNVNVYQVYRKWNN